VSAYRHTRQVRLVEIGEEGQGRLATLRVRDDAQARAAVAMDASVRVERVVRVERGAPARPLEPTPLDALEGMDESALDVGRGAWRALDTLRRVIAGAAPDAPDTEAP
jgi:hypothetical protein